MLSSLLPAATVSLPLAPRLCRRPAALVRWLPNSATLSGGSFTAGATSSGTSRSLGWDDVLRISSDGGDDPSDLRGYFERVRSCNRGSEFRSEFVPFVIEGQVAGYVHSSFANHLRRFTDVFAVMVDSNKSYSDGYVTLHPSLRTPEDRTGAVGHVIECLGSVIPAVPCESIIWYASILLARTSGCSIFWHKEKQWSLEGGKIKNNCSDPWFRTYTFLYFAQKERPHKMSRQWSSGSDRKPWLAYGVHMNGYVEKGDKKYLWIGKRSNSKPTFPGMLDHLVAGGLPHGITCKLNLVKECEEEAGIPEYISSRAIPVGAVSYMDIDGQRYKRDVLFCYDLKLPDKLVPKNEDGEVDSFRLIPVDQVANIIRRTEFFKPNCSLVIIDFLFRHGYLSPDDSGYLELLQCLRSGDCS